MSQFMKAKGVGVSNRMVSKVREISLGGKQVSLSADQAAKFDSLSPQVKAKLQTSSGIATLNADEVRQVGAIDPTFQLNGKGLSRKGGGVAVCSGDCTGGTVMCSW